LVRKLILEREQRAAEEGDKQERGNGKTDMERVENKTNLWKCFTFKFSEEQIYWQWGGERLEIKGPIKGGGENARSEGKKSKCALLKNW